MFDLCDFDMLVLKVWLVLIDGDVGVVCCMVDEVLVFGLWSDLVMIVGVVVFKV